MPFAILGETVSQFSKAVHLTHLIKQIVWNKGQSVSQGVEVGTDPWKTATQQ